MVNNNKHGPGDKDDQALNSSKENREPSNKSRQKNILDTIVTISNIGWTIIACVAIGVFIGFWVDKNFNTQPIFTIIFSILGILSAIYFLFRLSKN